MINLLPETVILANRKEYRLRRLTVLGFFALTVILICGVMETVLFFNLNVRQRLAKVSLQFEQGRFDKERFDQLNTELRRDRNKVKLLESGLKERVAFGGLLDDLLRLSQPGIQLANFDLSLVRPGEAEIQLRGSADNRPVFLDFVAALERSRLFLEINSPVSNLIRDKNLNFVLTLRLKKKSE